MLLTQNPTSSDYRIQADHLKEFVLTLKEEDAKLKAVLLDVIADLEKLAQKKRG